MKQEDPVPPSESNVGGEKEGERGSSPLRERDIRGEKRVGE